LSKCGATKYVVLNHPNFMGGWQRGGAGCSGSEESVGRAWALWCTLKDQCW